MTNTCTQLETSLIGSMLVSPNKIISIADKIKVTDFTDQKAQKAYTAIMAMWQGKRTVDLSMVAAAHPELTMFLADSVNQSSFGIADLAYEISSRAQIRRIKTGLEAASKMIGQPKEILGSIMDLYRHEMIVDKKDPGIGAVVSRVSKLISKNKRAGRVGFSTGFDIHERLYFRYLPGHIWTMGGFTSVGKTAVMVQKICNMLTSGEGARVVIISTEMTEEQVVARIISNFTGIHSMRILSGNFRSAEEEDEVEKIKTSLKGSPLTIYDDIYQLTDIELALRKAELQGGIDVVFIDYVQNCKWSEAKSQYQEQSEMAKRLQALAKDVRATIICLSQVSNDVGRGNTDQLELKGAGEWAAVSDMSVMLTRHKTEKHRLKYSIKKNRHGALGECEFEYKDEYTRVEEKR